MYKIRGKKRDVRWMTPKEIQEDDAAMVKADRVERWILIPILLILLAAVFLSLIMIALQVSGIVR